jgi:hypothetical protein
LSNDNKKWKGLVIQMTPHLFDGKQKWKRLAIEMIPHLFNGDKKMERVSNQNDTTIYFMANKNGKGQ